MTSKAALEEAVQAQAAKIEELQNTLKDKDEVWRKKITDEKEVWEKKQQQLPLNNPRRTEYGVLIATLQRLLQ